MKMKDLHDLYVHNLRDLYDAEKQILKALPKMAKAASNPQLQEGFRLHEEQTRKQIERLEAVFEEAGLKPRGIHCKGMEGLIAESQELLEEEAAPDVLDAGLIASAQKVEHYEISAYGTARTYAEQLNYKKSAKLLQEILDEEAMTDEKLTAMAESSINIEAEQ